EMEKTPSLDDGRLACRRQLDTRWHSVEQSRTQLRLQLLNRYGQRRLCQVQPLGRAAEVQRLCQDAEMSNPANIHSMVKGEQASRIATATTVNVRSGAPASRGTRLQPPHDPQSCARRPGR